MFKVNVNEFSSAAHDVLQATQDVRVAKERADAALKSWQATALGNWAKAGKAIAGNYKDKLSDLEGGLKGLSNNLNEANSKIAGTLLPRYNAVLDAAQAGGARGPVISCDEGVNVDASYDAAFSSVSRLSSSIADARNSLSGLENSSGIAWPLASLASRTSNARTRMGTVLMSYQRYKGAVSDFENTYAGKLDPDTFIEKGFFELLNSWVKGGKSLTSVPKHLAKILTEIGKFGGSVLPLTAGWLDRLKSYLGDWSPDPKKAAKGFRLNWWEGMTDWMRPSKWKDAWGDLDLFGKNSGMAGKAAEKSGDAIAGGSSGLWSKFTSKAKAAKKIFGYAGDALAVLGIATSSLKAAEKQKGDGYDKAGAATYEAVKGVAKFASGKAAGAFVGTVIGGPLGTVAGFAAGCVVDVAWNAVDNIMEKTGAKDAVIKGIGTIYRETGKFISNAWNGFKTGLGNLFGGSSSGGGGGGGGGGW